jgi:hypothetical protein
MRHQPRITGALVATTIGLLGAGVFALGGTAAAAATGGEHVLAGGTAVVVNASPADKGST